MEITKEQLSLIKDMLCKATDALADLNDYIDLLYGKNGSPSDNLLEKINQATESLQAEIVTTIDLPEEEKQAEGEPVPQHSDWRHANNEFHALLKELDIEVKGDFVLGFLWENYHVEKKTKLTPDQYMDLVKKFRKFSDFGDDHQREAVKRYKGCWISELKRRKSVQEVAEEVERARGEPAL